MAPSFGVWHHVVAGLARAKIYDDYCFTFPAIVLIFLLCFLLVCLCGDVKPLIIITYTLLGAYPLTPANLSHIDL